MAKAIKNRHRNLQTRFVQLAFASNQMKLTGNLNIRLQYFLNCEFIDTTLHVRTFYPSTNIAKMQK